MQNSPSNSRHLQNSFLSSHSNKENLHYYNTWDGSLNQSYSKIDRTQSIDQKDFANTSSISKQESVAEATASLKSNHNLIKLLPCSSQPADISVDHNDDSKKTKENDPKEALPLDTTAYRSSKHLDRSLNTSLGHKSFEQASNFDRNDSQRRRSLNYNPSTTYLSANNETENYKTKDQRNSPEPTNGSRDEKRTLPRSAERNHDLHVEPSIDTQKRESNPMKSINQSGSKQLFDSGSNFHKSNSKRALESCENRSKNNTDGFQETHDTQKRYHLDNSVFCKEIDFLKRALMDLEQENYSLRKDYEEAIANAETLKEQNEKKNATLKNLTQENNILQKRIREQEQSLEDLQMHVASMERCNKDLRNDSLQQIETIQHLLNQNSLEERKQAELAKELEENSKELKIIREENEGLKSKIKRLESIVSSFNHPPAQRSIVEHVPIEDSANISVQDLQPSEVNMSTLLFENSKLFSREDHYRIKAQSLQSRVDLLENELNVLRADLKRRGSFHQQREYESKAERKRSLSSEHLPSGELTFYKQFIDAIRTLVDVKTSDRIIPRIQDLLHEYKLLVKFSEAVQDMVSKCLPPKMCPGLPTLKQSWRFLKEILQEYVHAKSNQGNDVVLKQTMDKIANLLHTKQLNEVWPKIKYLAEENNRMALIISKFRSLNNFEPIPLSQLEKSLDDQLSYKYKTRYSFK